MNSFTKIDGHSASKALFKKAAYHEIMKADDTRRLELSTKYQVLCDKTAIIGVIKTKDKYTGELHQINQTIPRVKFQQE